MTTTDPIRILFASDLHFGVQNIPQGEMALAFYETVKPVLEETDIFFINGDFFDTLVLFDSHGFNPIYDVMLFILRMCEDHRIILRVLQGTWSHDRNQCEKFETFYRNGNFTFDYKFFNGIDLEEISIKERSLKVFYIPDDLPFKNSDDVVSIIKEKMFERGWDKVDYGCIHGFFDFTYPKMLSHEGKVIFKKTQFPFVNKMIDVGHVHQYRQDDNVFSNGSFDRICHGDEDPKGCIRILDYPTHYTAHFVKNKDAALFNTLFFSKEDTTESIRGKIKTHLDSLITNRTINLRCIIESSEFRDAIKTWMKENYPQVKCSIKKVEQCEDKPLMITSSVILDRHTRKEAPTPKTLAVFIRNHIPEDYHLSTDEISGYLERQG